MPSVGKPVGQVGGENKNNETIKKDRPQRAEERAFRNFSET